MWAHVQDAAWAYADLSSTFYSSNLEPSSSFKSSVISISVPADHKVANLQVLIMNHVQAANFLSNRLIASNRRSSKNVRLYFIAWSGLLSFMKESSLSRDIDQSSFLGFSSTYKNTQVLQNGIIAAAGDTHQLLPLWMQVEIHQIHCNQQSIETQMWRQIWELLKVWEVSWIAAAGGSNQMGSL